MKITKKHADTSHSKVQIYAYVIGFVLSIILTLTAYSFVSQHVAGHHAFLSHAFLITAVLVLAMAQLIVQLVFFLHIGREQKPRWNLQALLFAILVVAILVIGSLWIMANLNYNMQLERPDDSSVIQDEGFHN